MSLGLGMTETSLCKNFHEFSLYVLEFKIGRCKCFFISSSDNIQYKNVYAYST